MDKIKEANPNMLVVNASQGIKLIPNSAENEAETVDPHVWVDPKNAKIMVNNIYNGLVQRLIQQTKNISKKIVTSIYSN